MRRSALTVLLLAVAVAGVLAPSAQAVPPSPTGLPTVSGTARVGQTLSSTTGSWTGTAPITYTRRWLRCDQSGANCSTIVGASAANYTLVAADEGATIRVIVTATNVDGEDTATSASSPVVAPRSPPVNSAPPEISGAVRDGQALTATTGTWTGAAPISYTRRWQRCDATGADCAPLAAAATTYTLTSADVGSTIRVQVTATNPDGTAFAMSAATVVVDAAAPVNSVPPSTGGNTREGQTLTLTNPGTWTGTTPITYTQQWQRCATDGTACAPIADATGKSYVLTADDVGRAIRVSVSATNVKASTVSTSTVTPAIAPKAPPVNTVSPTISGTAIDGQVLAASNGTWTGTPTISYARRWQRCDAAGTNCAPLNATTGTYTLTPADVGSTIRVEVTATNPDGATVVATAHTAAVAPAPPSNTVLPTVSGTTREGQVLSATNGSWKGTPTIAFTHQWYRCTPACATIDGATGSTYRLQSGDVGATIRATVEATNAASSVTAWSGATATVTTGPPASAAPPEISGALARDGHTWSGTLGTWAGTGPQTYGRQWVRCNSSGSSCTVISGAAGDTYRFVSADVGKTVRLEVTAANSQGTVKAQSAPSPVIAAAPPSSDSRPTLRGELRDGQTLTAVSSWSGTPPIALTYAWDRCDAVTFVCSTIPGATAATYRLTAADVGAHVRVRIGASGPGGGGSDSSELSALVQQDPPRATALPGLSGTATEFETLTVSTTAFSGTPPLTTSVEWHRCDAAGESCALIPGATGTGYTLVGADRGHTIRAVVTASNDAGSDSATSAASAVVAWAPPRGTVAPAVSPDTGLKDGHLVTTSDGAWRGSEPRELRYAWHRCDPGGLKCAPIAGAAEATYRLTTADVGATIRSVVTAQNAGGTASQTSLPTGVVATNPPVNEVLPTMSGDAIDGAELRATDGTWTGLVPFTTQYRWWRCDRFGGNCAVVPNATEVIYRLRPADVDLTLRVQVLQTNPGGTTAAMSEPSLLVRAAAPENVVRPQVLGDAAVGRTLEADRGQWLGTPELVFGYQWRSCDAAGADCYDIPGATSSTYRLTTGDDLRTMRVVVTATNTQGAASALSDTSAEVSDDPPVSAIRPTIEASSLVAQGAVLTANRGAWAGAQPMTYGYQWRRCDASGFGCVDIAGAIERTYVLAFADVGKRIVATVSAENRVASAVAETTPTVTVLPEPPTNIMAPTVTAGTGGLRDGVKLTASTGTWRGATPIAYTVGWLRCNSAGTACAPIPDATGTSYTLTSADVGARIRARVVARNSATEVAIESDATAVVSPTMPVGGAKPTVVPLDGKSRVGGRLRAATGEWSGTAPLTLAVQWQRCLGSSLAACDDIPGARSEEYTLTEDDVGRRMRIVVTASNAAGTARADSEPTDIVPAVAPDNATLPTIAGPPPREGTELTASRGEWVGSAPLSFGFQWERCPSAGATGCPKIAGATRATYALVSADVGKVLRVSVTATNAAGRTVAVSAASAEVSGIAPRNTEAPSASVKGEVRTGGSLTAIPGKWAGTTPMDFTTRWQRCDERGLVCTNIPGGDKSTYTLKAEDLDGTKLKVPIRAVVTATNSAGNAEAASPAVGAIAPVEAPVTPAAAPKRVAKAKAAAQLRRIRLLPNGQLVITLACAKKARDKCGSTGSFASGRKLTGSLAVDVISRGRRRVKRIVLTPEQRKALRGKAALRFTVRIAAPATPTRPRVRRIRVKVPRALSGPVRKTTARRRPQKRAARKA